MRQHGLLALATAAVIGFGSSTATYATPIVPLPGSDVALGPDGDLFAIEFANGREVGVALFAFDLVVISKTGVTANAVDMGNGTTEGRQGIRGPLHSEQFPGTPTPLDTDILAFLGPSNIDSRILSLNHAGGVSFLSMRAASEDVVDPSSSSEPAEATAAFAGVTGFSNRLNGVFSFDPPSGDFVLAQLVVPRDVLTLGDGAAVIPQINIDIAIAGEGREENFQFSFLAPVPEPATASMLVMVGALGLIRRKR